MPRRASVLLGVLLVLAALCLVPLRARADSAQTLTERGNELYAAGEYDKALEAYEEAGAERPESAEIWFNKGSAHFQKGDYEKAREAFQAAALRPRDLSLEARSQFNLGNTAFAEGQKQLGQDAQKALSLFGTGVQHYRDALRIDPGLKEAAENIEIVRLKMKDVLDQIKKQQERAAESKRRWEEVRKKLEEVVAEQQSELEASENLKKEQDEAQGKDVREQAEKLSRAQDMTRLKTGEVEDGLKALQPPSPPAPEVDAGEKDAPESAVSHLEKAREAQKSAAEDLEGLKLDEARESQGEALDQLRKAREKLDKPENPPDRQEDRKQCDTGEQKPQDSGEQKKDSKDGSPNESEDRRKDGDQQTPAPSETQPRGKAGSGEKGEKAQGRNGSRESPENIFREEKENRLQFEKSRRGSYHPVERDW